MLEVVTSENEVWLIRMVEDCVWKYIITLYSPKVCVALVAVYK